MNPETKQQQAPIIYTLCTAMKQFFTSSWKFLFVPPRQDGITHTFLFVFLSFRNQNIVLLFPLVKPIDPCTFGVALFPPLAPDISKKTFISSLSRSLIFSLSPFFVRFLLNI